MSQDYDYYSIGDTSDISTNPTYGICLMGGATEDDNGATWFLNQADGGNIVVIRASGSDGYNDYFFNQLGVTVQSVETIVFNNASASSSAFVQRRIEKAEAVWIAGGDQFLYESYWKGTVIENLLNSHINSKQYPIGGTSAGMAILGEHYFNAANGTITSNTALNDPLNSAVSIESNFLAIPQLQQTITDTHYDNPDRKGRHTVFLAHLLTENGGINYGIAADEYVAICIDKHGIATIYGQHPNYEDYAYFLRTNCDEVGPGTFMNNTPLNWMPNNNDAIQTCVMEATIDGNQQFDLTNWENLNGGSWEDWNVINGSLTFSASSFEPCNLSLSKELMPNQTRVYPNPARSKVFIEADREITNIKLVSPSGKTLLVEDNLESIVLNAVKSGLYYLRIQLDNGVTESQKIIIL